MLNPPVVDSADYDQSSADADVGPAIFDLREIYAALYRSRYMLAAIIGGSLLLGVAFLLLTTRQYAGVASVEVRQEAEKVLGTEQDRESASNKMDIDRFLDTQIDLVRSRSVIIAVAEELRLFRGDSFLQQMNVTNEPETNGVLTEQEAQRELVIETLLDNLQVGYSGETRILIISFLSPDSRLSAKVANSFAVNYIRSNLQRKSDSSAYALEFLRGQLREAQVRLEQSERASLEYARRTRIVDASNAARSAGNSGETTQPQSLITAQLVQLNEAYSTALAERIEAEQRWRRISKGSVLNVPEVLSNQAVQGLLERRAVAESEYREQLETRREDFPSVRQAAARLAEIDRQLSAVAGNIRNSVQSQYQIAVEREQQLARQLDSLKGMTLVEQNQTIQLSILRREADTNRQQYESLLQRFNQLNAESGVQANNLAFVDRAVPNQDAAWPNVPVTMALALICGGFLSILYLIVNIQLFDKIRTSFDVTERLSIPLLGAIPNSPDVMGELQDQKSEISEAFNLVRTGVSLSTEHGMPKSAMVTSVQASEGKTSCCMAVALGFARLGKRVLLIDLDMRRPNIHRQLELSNKFGSSSVLSGQARAEEAIQKSSFANLDVLTGGPIPPSPTDLIMGRQFDDLILAMTQIYDLVLVDSPPVLALADAELLASRVDATMFVIESGRNSRKAVLGAVSRIRRTGARVIGVLLTKYDPGELGYGYYSDYAYQYRYGSTGPESDT